MRYVLALLLLCGTFAFAQDTTEAPVEVVTADEGDNDDVAVNVDNNKKDKPEGGCGCGGKPKI